MVLTRSIQSERGWLAMDLMVAIVILALAMIPLAFSFNSEQRLLRANYNQAIAMEIVDGEMEILRAGGWRRIADGEHDYKVSAGAATNLPPGRFVSLRTAQELRLEWRPDKRGKGGLVARAMRIP